jgi:hypothetical protein
VITIKTKIIEAVPALEATAALLAPFGPDSQAVVADSRASRYRPVIIHSPFPGIADLAHLVGPVAFVAFIRCDTIAAAAPRRLDSIAIPTDVFPRFYGCRHVIAPLLLLSFFLGFCRFLTDSRCLSLLGTLRFILPLPFGLLPFLYVLIDKAEDNDRGYDDDDRPKVGTDHIKNGKNG